MFPRPWLKKESIRFQNKDSFSLAEEDLSHSEDEPEVESYSTDSENADHDETGKPPAAPKSIGQRVLKIRPHLRQLYMIQQEHYLNKFQQMNAQRLSCYNDSCNLTPGPQPDAEEQSQQQVYRSDGRKKKRVPGDFGPFLSCSAYHTHGSAYTEWVQKPNLRKVVNNNQFGRPNSASSRPTSAKAGPDANRCRHCPSFDVTSSLKHSDSVYEDYKASTTYSKTKIGKQHSDKITEKFEAFEMREDKDSHSTSEESAWGVKVINMNNLTSWGSTSFALPTPLSSRKPIAAVLGKPETMLYGPAAIASVSGYNFNPNSPKSGRSVASNKSVPVIKPKPIIKSDARQTQSLEGFVIPLPSDNVRYYDGDYDDPIITELLANSEFNVSLDDKTSPRISEGNQSIRSSNSTKKHKKPLEIPEYTVGSGRKSIEKTVNKTKSDTVKKNPIDKTTSNSPALISITSDKSKAQSMTQSDATGDSVFVKTEPPLTERFNDILKIGNDTAKGKLGLEPTNSPKPVKVAATRVHKKGIKGKSMAKIISKKKSKAPPRFRQNISTVSLPQPSSKYKIMI